MTHESRITEIEARLKAEGADGENEANAALIANAPSDIRFLLDENAALRNDNFDLVYDLEAEGVRLESLQSALASALAGQAVLREAGDGYLGEGEIMNRVLTDDEKNAMEKLSLAILDLCDNSGLDGELIANATIIGAAGVIASTIPDDARETVVQALAARAGGAISREIVVGYNRFKSDLAAAQGGTIQ